MNSTFCRLVLQSPSRVRMLTRWVCRPVERAKVVENCRSAARPDASRLIARALGEKVGLAKRASSA